jgi:hypothetical protein
MVRLAVNVARHRERSLPSTRVLGLSSSTTRTPRPMCSRVTTTGGRSPGSRVTAFRRLPGIDPSGNGRKARRLQLRGQPRNRDLVQRTALTAFPFDPPKENRREDTKNS